MLFLYFFLSFLISLILIPFLKKIAEKKELFDIPQGDVLKIHKKPIPVLGGLVMLIASILVLLFFCLEKQDLGCKIAAIISGSLIIFLLGFWDDLKWKHVSQIKPYFKFLFLIIFPLISGLILFSSGIKFNFFPEIILAGFFTFLYIFVLINAVNYQDGMDGLAGGLVVISLIGFTVLGLISENNLALILSLILLGAVSGFLIFNLPPAKIFMGDSGAYFLGFILAVLAIIFSQPYNISSILGPVFIIGLPIFDGVFANIRRLFQKKSIFLGDRKHFYDRILQRGFSARKTLLISYSLQIISAAIGLLFLTLEFNL